MDLLTAIVEYPHQKPFATTQKGVTLGDMLGAAILSPWDFLPKILVFFQVPWERGSMFRACSGDNVQGVNNLL